MAKTETTVPEAQPRAAVPTITAMAVMAPLLTWFIPGAGHLIQKKWIRGALLLISVAAMFCLGLAMNGKVYKPNTGDLLDMLGFVGDLGAGGLYLMARVSEWGAAAIYAASGDYGTKFIVVSGLLNVISMVDAYHIAIGRKQ